MATQPQQLYTPEQYLAREREAEHKSEYISGEIFAMAGASESHNIITLNIASEIRQQFKGKPCRTYCNDMRVHIQETNMYTYPDITALCDTPEFSDSKFDILTNPSVVIEVLSPSTEAYDRGLKFAHYRRLVSLQQYVLVSQNKPLVEVYTRVENNQWLLSEVMELQGSVRLEAIDVTLALAEIYDRIEWTQSNAAAEEKA